MDEACSMVARGLAKKGDDIVLSYEDFINYSKLFPDGGVFTSIHQLQLWIWRLINYMLLAKGSVDWSFHS